MSPWNVVETVYIVRLNPELVHYLSLIVHTYWLSEMFRSVALRSLTRSLFPRTQVPQIRGFSSSLVTFKKVKAGKASSKHSSKVVEEEPLSQEDPSLILKELEAKYQESLNHFREKVAVTKQGNSNPNLFDDLKVALNHGEVADFLSIAQTSLKGRNLIITVFDPIYAKHVISAILQTNLNLNPEHVPNMPQQLKVSLPPVTRETKLDIVKELKKNFEFFKNSNSFKYSLSSNRADALKELKQFKKNDQTKKTTNDIEKLHKKYTNDLQELFRSAEKQILQ